MGLWFLKRNKDNSLDLYLRLLKYARNFWWAFIIAIIGTILFSAFDAIFMYLLKPMLNLGFIAREITFIKILPFLIIFLFILRACASFVSNYFMAIVSRGVILTFRQNIFEHLTRMPATYYDNNSSGKILSVILFNVEQVANAGCDSLSDLIQSLCSIIGLIVVMFVMSWQLSLLNLITLPIIIFSVRWSSLRQRLISANIQKQMGDITNIAEESIEGYKVVRAYGGETYETNKFVNAIKKNRWRELKIVATKSVSISLAQLIVTLNLALTIYLAISHVAGPALSAGSFVSFLSSMLMLLKPLKTFSTVNGKIQRGLAGAESIFELLDRLPEKDTGKLIFTAPPKTVEFENVSFSYIDIEKNQQVLTDVNFEILHGQKVALVGASGSGKTTIINLLQRFYDGYSGKILIDNVNINEYKLSSLRMQFAAVSQHVTLFNDTVRHNIAYGSFENANIKDIISAAKAANAWEFIQQMPHGLDTVIGENGVLLSGGQRQRIAIARAILKNAPILLLDEATSALDTVSEKQIQIALDHLMENRTTLVIAHRLSTIENVDTILVLDNGKIVEQGSHLDLIKRNGLYAKLYKTQFMD